MKYAVLSLVLVVGACGGSTDPKQVCESLVRDTTPDKAKFLEACAKASPEVVQCVAKAKKGEGSKGDACDTLQDKTDKATWQGLMLGNLGQADAKPEAAKPEAAKPPASASKKDLGPLSAEVCEKGCRKWNIDCAIKGAPPPKDPEGMIKMCTEACVIATKTGMEDASISSHAEALCLDKADCKEFKDCVDDKETELKGN